MPPVPPSLGASLVSDASPAWGALRWLLDLAMQATLLLIAAGAVALLLRRASAATRHLVWALALGGLLALPLLSVFMPRQMALLSPLPAPPMPQVLEAPQRPVRVSEKAKNLPVESPAPKEPTQQAPSVADDPAPLPQDSESPAWAVGALSLWLCGALLAASRIAAGLRGIGELGRHSLPLAQSQLLEEARQAQQALPCRRPVALLVADAESAIVVPVTWGWRRPVLLLPSDAPEWPPTRQRAVLLHELGHVVRGDWAALMVAQAACVLFWFHPLAWRAARSLRSESEQATDDQVLAAGMRASDYGECLLEFVRLLKAAPRKPMMNLTVAMAQLSTLEKRLLALLDARRKRHGVSRAQVLAGVAVASVALLSVATMGTVGGDQSALAADSKAAAAGRYGGTVTLSGRQNVSAVVVIQSVPAGRGGKSTGRSTAALYFTIPYGSVGTPTPAPNRADAPLDKALHALPLGQLLPPLPPFNVNQRTGTFSTSRQYSPMRGAYLNIGIGRVTLSGILPRSGRAGSFALSLGGRVFRGTLSSPGPSPAPTPTQQMGPTPTATPTPSATATTAPTSDPSATPTSTPMPDPGPTATPTAVTLNTPAPPGTPATVFLSKIRGGGVDPTPLVGRGITGTDYEYAGYSNVLMQIEQVRADGVVRALNLGLYVPDHLLTGQTFPVTTDPYTMGATVYYGETRGSISYFARIGTVTVVSVKGHSLQLRLNNVHMELAGGAGVGGDGRPDFVLNGTLQATIKVSRAS